MAGRKTIAITDRQFEALRILWDQGPLTVRQLMEELATLELAVSAALAEREGLERLLLRVQKLVAIS